MLKIMQRTETWWYDYYIFSIPIECLPEIIAKMGIHFDNSMILSRRSNRFAFIAFVLV